MAREMAHGALTSGSEISSVICAVASKNILIFIGGLRSYSGLTIIGHSPRDRQETE